ncbi:antibiotic resistance protein VanZ [Roseibium algae]|uniref:Antibiotic resistance protein VanZ n=1 Tax=Roseibium algae TaxID=3123038 RepID=A0ABU8TL86_9HYPH
MPRLRLKLPKFIQTRVNQHYLDISLNRLLPLIALLTFGLLAGLVFNTGVVAPYDKILHVGFYALLTLSIHSLFCCRLRISAIVAFSLGLLGEGAQAFLPHHEASLPDAFANGIGVALVVAAIALMRSEKRQAVRSQPVEFDYQSMGLEPCQSGVSSKRSSEK